MASSVAVPPERRVDAVTRGIDDLNVGTWIAFTGFAACARTAMQHPFVLACSIRMAHPREGKTSSFQLLRDMRAQNGGSWRVMFRGFPALASGVAISEVAYMWLYEELRNPSGSPLIPVTPLESGLPSPHFLDASAGFIADFVTTIISVPFFFIANRQMCAGIGVGAAVVYASARRTMAAAIEGPKGYRVMFAGMSASLMLSTHSAFWWMWYQDLKARTYPACAPTLDTIAAKYPRIPSPFVSTSDNMVINSVAAVVAGLAIAPIWNPILVIRTRMQIDTSDAPPRFRDVARSIWRTEGARGFTKGTCMAMVAFAVDGVAFSMFYEVGKQIAQRAPVALLPAAAATSA